MTRLIVETFSVLIEVLLVVLLLAGALAGHEWIPDQLFGHSELSLKGGVKALLGLLGAFFLEVLLVGPLLILVDIGETLREISRRLASAESAKVANG